MTAAAHHGREAAAVAGAQLGHGASDDHLELHGMSSCAVGEATGIGVEQCFGGRVRDVARRDLVGTAAVEQPDERVEDQVTSLLHLTFAQRRGGVGPTADDLALRAAERDAVEAMPPPRVLGDPEAPPPLAALPPAVARATAALMSNLGADATPSSNEVLHGIGIGDSPYRGRACVVRDGIEALERLEPGDVLIAAFTGPSCNSFLPILGALVVEEGGLLCHAAIVAREFGLPAVIGAGQATTRIPDGAMVEVDPRAGVVRLG